jgi:Ca-activated chloride channel family protein
MGETSAEAFAERLVQLRRNAGLTLDELAKQTSYAKGTLTQATNGKVLPSWQLTQRYVEACDGAVAEWKERWDQASATESGQVKPVAQPPADERPINEPDPPPKRRKPVILGVALVLGVALAAMLTYVVWQASAKDPEGALPSCSGPATDEVRIAASQDKSQLLGELAKQYGLRGVDGRCVQVVVGDKNSGVAMSALAKGWTEADGPRPDVWSPASSMWLALAKHRAAGAASQVLPDESPQPIVTTPLMIALPQPMAQALGWPKADIGWHELAELATDPQGWASYGHPEWGQFRLGKTNPAYSGSGLNATIGAFFAFTGRTDELTLRDIDNPALQDSVRKIERSIVHYGSTTLAFLANLRQADDNQAALSYISAVSVEESSMVAYNEGYACGAPGCPKQAPPRTKLVGIYPREGALFSDHPYIELRGMDAPKKAVADDFLTYLHSPAAQGQFGEYGFRDYQGKPNSTVTNENGADPGATLTPLGVPKGPVLDRLLNTWPKLRKPANVLVAIDASGSMADPVPGTGSNKIDLVKQAKYSLFGTEGFSDTDRVGLWKFSAGLDGPRDYVPLVPIGGMSEPLGGTTRRDQLVNNVEGLAVDGGTGLYDTIAAAVNAIHSTVDSNAINAVVLLTDGRNQKDGGIQSVDALLAALHASSTSQFPVRVFTIAYGSEADQTDKNGKTVLQEIAVGTGGAAYNAKDPTSIAAVLADVVSNF